MTTPAKPTSGSTNPSTNPPTHNPPVNTPSATSAAKPQTSLIATILAGSYGKLTTNQAAIATNSLITPEVAALIYNDFLSLKVSKRDVADADEASNNLNEWLDTYFTAVEDGNPATRAISTTDLPNFLEAFVVKLGDIGTSPFTSYEGIHVLYAVGATHHSVSMTLAVDTVKAHGATIRQFASYHAPLAWNWYATHRPPANWARKGYLETNYIAGFDFFTATTNPAAMNGQVKLVRNPTKEELLAGVSNRDVAIARARIAAAGTQSTLHEISNGRTSAAVSGFHTPNDSAGQFGN